MSEVSRCLRMTTLSSRIDSIQSALAQMTRYWAGMGTILGAIKRQMCSPPGGPSSLTMDDGPTTDPVMEVDEWMLPKRYRRRGANIN